MNPSLIPEHLSASRINTYLQCPKKYELQYIDKVPWLFTPIALVFGTAIHVALEAYYLACQENKEITVDELKEHFSQSMNDQTEAGKKFDVQNTGSVKQQGIELLEVFYDNVHPQDVVAVEEAFTIPLKELGYGLTEPIALVGRIDLIEMDHMGSPVIVDHKTLARRPSDNDMLFNFQLLTYAFSARRLGIVKSDDDVLLRIDALLKTKTPSFDQRYVIIPTERDKLFLNIAGGVLKGIFAGAFPPNPGWACDGCPVGYCCPATGYKIGRPTS